MMVSRRSLETATAVLTGAFGAAVVVSSYGNGIGWSAAGVDSGTFPDTFPIVSNPRVADYSNDAARKAAVTFNAAEATGLDGALRRLLQYSWGAALCAIVGIGFVAYGIFCLDTFMRKRLQAP